MKCAFDKTVRLSSVYPCFIRVSSVAPSLFRRSNKLFATTETLLSAMAAAAAAGGKRQPVN
ncbi:MAG TPA: hypothetical protein VN699_10750, partial [Pirellulales bacterium]|nr:hypothetical protein [Pirellulales bacterium]